MKRLIKRSSVIVALVGWLSMTWAQAETVVLHLRNGDRLTGTLVSEDTNRVVIGTPWQKELAVPKAEISNRETASPGKPDAAAAVAVAKPVGTPAAPAKTAPPVTPKPLKHWNADLQFGLDVQESTKDRTLYYTRDKLTFGRELAQERDRLRNILDYSYSYGRTEGVRSTDRMDGSSKTDYDLAKLLFIYNLGGAGYDKIRKIDLQYEEGPGLGYHLFALTNFVLNAEAGLNYQVQQFSDNTETKNIYYRLAQDMTWKINSRMEFVQKMEFFPQADTLDKYRVRFDSTVRYALLHNLFINLSVTDLYDSRPAANVDPNDLQIRSSIGVKF